MNLSAAYLLSAVASLACAVRLPAADLVINEVLFNPPGADSAAEYIEFRGVPNSLIDVGTWFIAVEGDATANPGTIQNAFDLSGLRVGGDGFLVLLQKDSPYVPDPRSGILANTNSGSGWGTGTGSSVRHMGNNGLTELKNAAVTYFLLGTSVPPAAGADLDVNDDGVLDAGMVAGWTVLDSIGVLDTDGAGDFAYGAINFRRNAAPGNSAGALGVVVPVGFTPRYIGRAGNTSGSGALDWAAGDALGGTAPAWSMGAASNTYPSAMAGMSLNHIGAANFGASAIPGVLVSPAAEGSLIPEGGLRDVYTLGLNTVPAGPVTITIACPPGLEVSVDNGFTFGTTRTAVLADISPRLVTLRAPADEMVDVSPRWRWITNSVSASTDPLGYPLSMLIPPVRVGITEKHSVLLNELKVNPPGTNDGPNEFIEIKGPAGMTLTNVFILAIEGDAGAGPGRITWKADLTGQRIGDSGLLIVAPTNTPYAIPADTTKVVNPQMSQPEGALGNGTTSFLLLSTSALLAVGDDLDRGNNGILEGLPADTTVLDSVAWKDGDNNDIAYGAAVLYLSHGAPDAAMRLPWNETPCSAEAWIWGDLDPESGESLVFDAAAVSPNFPVGTPLTPGLANELAPFATGLTPISGVIGDPYNPVLAFLVNDDQTPPASIVVTASSSNPEVVPSSNLVVTAGAGGDRTLSIIPVGVGYAQLTLSLSDGTRTGRVNVAYAASAPGRPGGTWHAGASDASTAIAVDDQYMLVGDDENQVLRLYDRRRSGLPLAQFDMTADLQLPDGSTGLPREVDVEASTRVGNRLYWIGSLGHAADGEPRTNRTRVFATDLSGAGVSARLTYAGRYDFLKVDFIAWDVQNLHGKGANYYGLDASDADGVPPKAPDGSGFAIEGLCMMPGSTNGAFVGFRAPIVPATNRTFALVVPVLNFTTLAASGGPPGSAIFGPPIELDLYDRGIRSIEGSSNGYFIVAGPPGARTGPYPMDFRLYTWTGNGTDQPRQRTADFSELNPEGIVEIPPLPWSSETPIQLLSDGGATVYYGDDIAAKFLSVQNFKKFRTDWVPIGTVVGPAPLILSASLSSGVATIRWRALKGATYIVQSSTDLRSDSWKQVAGPVTAFGPYAEESAALAGSSLFFRVVLLP